MRSQTFYALRCGNCGKLNNSSCFNIATNQSNVNQLSTNNNNAITTFTLKSYCSLITFVKHIFLIRSYSIIFQPHL